MKIEKMEVAGVDVKNLDNAIKLFSDILETKFIKYEPKLIKTLTKHADRSLEGIKIKIAIDPTGYMELIESIPPVKNEGLRNIHFKVPNIEEAKAELQKKGLQLDVDLVSPGGHFKEAVFHKEDLCGIRFCLVEYTLPSLIEAISKE